eukprot:CAMPEP_0168210622 /NCGR_PEP_ID=MMETSP0140_2-20121125/3272_1 /TAXON_ID=44445 /ORGANISM="Pseudo-nitzschia australis, Strain 10249 10 AB" /LENGTH=775 /DNA_ID=CAMNT_0008137243 /DNA_START=1493 /DNA_END=3820 /DNA_ORIENTATION=-
MFNDTNSSTCTSNSRSKRTSKKSLALEESTNSKKKKVRRSTAVQIKRHVERIGAERLNTEHTYRTIIENVRQQQYLCNGKVLIAPIVKRVNEMYNTNWKLDTIRRRLRDGTENTVPRKGRKKQLPEFIEKSLSDAIVSFINLGCSEMKDQTRRTDIIEKLTLCIEGGPGTLTNFPELYRRLYPSFANDVVVVTGNSRVEARRVKWTTYHNLNMWFDTLKEVLVKNGFAKYRNEGDDGEGELVYLPNKLNHILNLDKSGLTLDQTGSLSGGRDSTRFRSADNAIAFGADRTNKSSCRLTIIAGSTAAGHPLPLHFQLMSVAEDRNKRIENKFVRGISNVVGVYGEDKIVNNRISVNCNATAGMDTVEFKKYLSDSIVPLYPNASDVKGKRVLLIVDSGPGRKDETLLAYLQARGFLLHPGVPNTTHVPQPTDQNYGYFKTLYRKNLKTHFKYRQSKKETVRQNDFPLLVFGNQVNRYEDIPLERAFEKAFSVERSKGYWEKIGISPFTRRCLCDGNVTHELVCRDDGSIDVDADPTSGNLIEYERMNAEAVKVLNNAHYNGEVFQKCAPRRQAVITPLTTANTRARQDAIAGVRYSSQHFVVTKGDTLNSKDYFFAQERQRRNDEIKCLEGRKKKSKMISNLNAKALGLIEEFASKGKEVYKEEDAKSLPVTALIVLCQWKQQSKIPLKKDLILDMWLKVKNVPSPIPSWSSADDDLLEKLKTDEIEMADTALGREKLELQKKSLACLAAMNEEDMKRLNISDDIMEGLQSAIEEV